MKVIVDDKIPYIKEAISRLADEVVFLPGRDFTPEEVRDADALIVRTRTRCDRALLEGSRVQFIATATIGFDHIDTAYLREAGISWTNCPGCNATSVAQYVRNALLLLQAERGWKWEELTLGIVGVGHVGSAVEQEVRRLGLQIVRCDPPRQRMEKEGDYLPLEELARRCDILTFHVPLQRSGADRTFHLADTAFFHSLQRQPVLLNTSRGEVVETQALREALHNGQVSQAIIDVWENEPDIDRDLLQEVWIGTPHIAGYSADGKANATRMALDAFCRHFHLQADYHIEPPALSQPLPPAHSYAEACLQLYDPRRDSEALKAHPERFEQLRGNYPLRREQL